MGKCVTQPSTSCDASSDEKPVNFAIRAFPRFPPLSIEVGLTPFLLKDRVVC